MFAPQRKELVVATKKLTNKRIQLIRDAICFYESYFIEDGAWMSEYSTEEEARKELNAAYACMLQIESKRQARANVTK